MNFDAQKYIDLALSYAPRVIGVFVLLFIAWIIAGWASRAIRRSLEKRAFDTTLTRFFANMTRYLILLAAVLGCLGVFGIQTSSFAAILAAAGFAIGMAFQGTLSNFSAGVMLLVFRPFKVGDFVNVADVEGICEHIDLFTCEFKSLDNRKLVIPNSEVFGKTITNYTGYPLRRVDIDIGADYGVDIDATRAALEKALQDIPGMIQDPAPQIFLSSLGASSVDWQVRVWCKTDDYWDVWQATVRASKKALEQAGINIPFPQMDVHLDGKVVQATS